MYVCVYIYIYIYMYVEVILINLLVLQLAPPKQKFLAPLLCKLMTQHMQAYKCVNNISIRLFILVN